MLLLIFVLGFFIEWIEISYIVVPLFIPLLTAANVDPVWTATLMRCRVADIVPDASIRMGAVLSYEA